jgi:molybdenum cofactor cytidylyltransferase
VTTVNKILLSKQAYSNLISLSPRERLSISNSLLQLSRNPKLGLKLWGRESWYLYETFMETKIVYRLSGEQVQVLAIKAIPEHPVPLRVRVSAVVLAAGRTDYGHSLPISHVTEAFLAAGVDDLIVVLGYQAEQAKKALQNQEVKIVVNPDYEHGLSKSLRFGLKIVPRDTVAVLLTLGNRPYIKPKLINSLVRAYKQEQAPIVVPTYLQMRGHPVIFDNILIPELLKTRGDVGGRGVLQHHSQELKQVEVEDAGILERA